MTWGVGNRGDGARRAPSMALERRMGSCLRRNDGKGKGENDRDQAAPRRGSVGGGGGSLRRTGGPVSVSSTQGIASNIRRTQ